MGEVAPRRILAASCVLVILDTYGYTRDNQVFHTTFVLICCDRDLLSGTQSEDRTFCAWAFLWGRRLLVGRAAGVGFAWSVYIIIIDGDVLGYLV